jgi:hypothetical protein
MPIATACRGSMAPPSVKRRMPAREPAVEGASTSCGGETEGERRPERGGGAGAAHMREDKCARRRAAKAEGPTQARDAKLPRRRRRDGRRRDRRWGGGTRWG